MVENGNDGSREKDGVPLMVAREGHGLTVAQRGQVVTQLIGNSTGVPDSRGHALSWHLTQLPLDCLKQHCRLSSDLPPF